MAIPKYDEMYQKLLQYLSDCQPHKLKEIRSFMAVEFHVSEEEQKLLNPSGKQTIFSNRVHWSCTYLKKASLIQSPSRGVYQISAEGEKVLKNPPEKINNDFLMQYESFRKFQSPPKYDVQKGSSQDTAAPSSDDSPQDILDAAYTKINNALKEDILSEIMKQSPQFFERMVLRLLTQMGYGGSLENAGTLTRATGDEGIDGIIREDKLGFDKIYIQAKRWEQNNAVGRPELQKFVGALAGQGAGKGLFITTSQFTKEARTYAEKQHTTKIVLVDGETLAGLMIEYNVGVSVETTYSVKRIDSDFFDDPLN